MSSKWPQFVTNDLGSIEDAELMRRWQAYDRDMKALIAKGGVHQDNDGWWVETASGELIGPDPEIERPVFDDESQSKTLKEVLPDLHETIKRSRGRPPVDNPKQAITLRLDPAIVEHFKAYGDNWRAAMAEALRKSAGI